MTFVEQLLWVIYPYTAMTVFVVGLILRYDRDPYNWTSKSSQLLEGKMLMYGSVGYHYAFFFVLIGHIMGLVVPVSLYNSLGVTASMYHDISYYGGSVAGVVGIVALVILVVRRLKVPGLKATSGVDDYVTLGILFFVFGTGIANTLGYSTLVGMFDYRYNIAPWFRGLFLLSPNPALVSGIPLSYQIHILVALLFFALIPFTRLVHMFSVPIPYLWRKNIVYRRISAEGKRVS